VTVFPRQPSCFDTYFPRISFGRRRAEESGCRTILLLPGGEFRRQHALDLLTSQRPDVVTMSGYNSGRWMGLSER
jgi:hypothetical protein